MQLNALAVGNDQFFNRTRCNEVAVLVMRKADNRIDSFILPAVFLTTICHFQ
jgi:hypothetical protein